MYLQYYNKYRITEIKNSIDGGKAPALLEVEGGVKVTQFAGVG
jgi:hypothetical protein